MVIDILFKIIEWVFPWAKGKIITPLHVNITKLDYEEMINRPYDPIVIITPYPYRYFATLQITNYHNEEVYIKEITLFINEKQKFNTEKKMPICLQPHQFAKYNIIFPTKKALLAVISGEFRIEVIPALGRKTKVSGLFPIKN